MEDKEISVYLNHLKELFESYRYKNDNYSFGVKCTLAYLIAEIECDIWKRIKDK